MLQFFCRLISSSWRAHLMSKYNSNQIIPYAEAEIPLTWAHRCNFYFNGQQVSTSLCVKGREGRLLRSHSAPPAWQGTWTTPWGSWGWSRRRGEQTIKERTSKSCTYEDFHIYLNQCIFLKLINRFYYVGGLCIIVYISTMANFNNVLLYL